MDGSMQSSPDPLNASQSFHQSPPKARRAARVRTSLPLQGSSPKKQTFELDVGNQLSPQKIRVTVEAGESDVENTYARYADYNDGNDISPTLGPVSRRRERTTTTTVPVKGLSDSEEEEVTQSVATPKRGRGRPRKTAGTPVPAKKNVGRSSTPTQKIGRRKSVGELIDGDDEEDINFELGKSIEVNRGKKDSRSRSRKGTKPTQAPKSQNETNEPSSAAPKKRGCRRSLPQAKVDVPEDDNHPSNNDYNGRSELPSPQNSNGQYSVSPDPTSRSITSRAGEPDVVIARFHPGNETPYKTGWSSPRVYEGQTSGSQRRSDNYPSPSLSPDKLAFDRSDKEMMAAVGHEQSDEEVNEEEAQDDVGEMREFDTILESEGFSMISVDSVPSLRKHLSSPVERPMPGKKAPVMKSFRAVQEADASAYNDSFSEIPEEVLAAATPAKEARNPRLLSVQATREDSFPDSISAQPPTSKRTSPARTHGDEDCDDSFSVIPAEILDAATPAAIRQQRPATFTQGLPAPPSATSPVATGSASGSRLLTPERSPSPPPATSKIRSTDVQGEVSSSRSATRDVAADESSLMQSHLPSSPPVIAPRRYTYTAHLRQNRQFNSSVIQTPFIVFSSPSLPPPPIQVPKANASLAPASDHSDRPALSPIARAGRMLQNIVVPSSPRSRSQSLGSPFKSPAADKRSSSILGQSLLQGPVLERRVAPLPQLDLSSQLSVSSAQPPSNTRHQEDPFRSSGSRAKRSPSPEEQEAYSLGVPQDHQYPDPRLSSLRSRPASLGSDNDMSWQAEEEMSVPEPTSSTHIFRSEHNAINAEERWSADRAEVIKQAALADTDRRIVIDSDDEKLDHDEADDDDGEGFGQLLETLNSSSPPAPKGEDLARDMGEKPRRSKIPSPWRKNSKRLVYSDELSHMSSPPIAEKIPVTTRLAKEAISQPVTVRRISDSELSFEGDSAEFSGWQIPQKSNFNPRPRENYTADLSALFAASPPKRLPVLSKATYQPFGQQETITQKSDTSDLPHSVENARDRSSGFAPITQKSGFNPRPRASFTSSIQPALGPNLFTAKSRDTEINTPSEPSNSSSASRPLSVSSPSRTNTLPAYRTPPAEVSALNSDQDSSVLSTSDKENQITNSRTLKWTESLQLQPTRTFVQTPIVTTSPVKSCLRSPMKTPSHKTIFENPSPSKAVAFVSSSPMPSSPMVSLSSTTWSKDHWRVLDTILQQWKPENQTSCPLSPSDGSAGKERRRRNSTRVISRLLGKTVACEGQKLVLEQWHLEVVDEFRGVVPGWEEQAVAMRVFSLLIGEEKRVLKMRLEAEREIQKIGCEV